jgi:hypothetical protein
VEEEEAEVDIRADGEVEVQGDPLRLKVDLKVHRPLMPQLDRRMLASLERTIVVVVGAAIEASTLMLVVESRNDAFFSLQYSALLSDNWFGGIENALWMAHIPAEFSYILSQYKILHS